MFGLGMPEIIVILVIALIIFGPSKLPEVARGIGKGIREFKDMTMGVERSMKDEFEAIIQDGEEPPKPADKPKPPADKAEEEEPPATDMSPEEKPAAADMSEEEKPAAADMSEEEKLAGDAKTA